MKINIRNLKQNKRHFKLVPKNIESNITLPDITVNPTLIKEGKTLTFCLSEKEEIKDLPPEGQFGEDLIVGDDWSLITFDELDTINPSYTLLNTVLGEVFITTNACFVGQTISQNVNGSYAIEGSPSSGISLTLSTESSFYTQIKQDSANPDTPVLAGSIGYDSPVSVLFSKDVHAVGLTGGFFDDIGSTYIEVYDRLGNIIGQAIKTQTGTETFGFSAGSPAKIAGFSFYVNSLENAGFALDNLKFK